MANSERKTPGTTEDTASDLWALIARTEAAARATSISTEAAAGGANERAASAELAVRAATRLAEEGRRASALLTPRELMGALESIHAAARARAPMVVHVIGGASGPSLGRDELAPALELGAGVLVAWSAQDSMDLALAARRAAEDSETPWIVFSDASGASASSIHVPDTTLAAHLLGDASSSGPRAREDLLESKRAERGFAARAPFALGSALRESSELTGRPLAALERFETADAEDILVAVGQAFPAARAVAEAMRLRGLRVGALGIRALRPFFAAETVKALSRARSVAVIEPLDVALAPSGPLATCIKAAFADALTWAAGFPGVGRIPPIVSAVFATLNGGVGEREVRAVLDELQSGDRARRLLVFGSAS